MKVFVSGGCKNGKSTYAESISVALLNRTKPIGQRGLLYYIATMEPVDREDEERIVRHRKSRELLHFDTVECGRDISRVADLCHMEGTFLLDSATALLSNEMFLPQGGVNLQAHIKVAGELVALLDKAANMVIVSDYIYSDAQCYDEYTEAYRRGLGFIDCRCAAACDIVIEVCYNSLIVHKGQELWEGIDEAIS